MAQTVQSIIDQAEQLAIGVGGDDNTSALIDSEYTAEEIFPHAFRYALERMASSGAGLADLITPIVITVVDGAGVLPRRVLKNAWKTSYLRDSEFASYLTPANYRRFTYSATGQQDYYTFEDAGPSHIEEVWNFRYTQAGTASFDGDVTLMIAAVPELPTDFSTEIDLTDKMLQAIILTLAGVLRGEIPLLELGMIPREQRR